LDFCHFFFGPSLSIASELEFWLQPLFGQSFISLLIKYIIFAGSFQIDFCAELEIKMLNGGLFLVQNCQNMSNFQLLLWRSFKCVLPSASVLARYIASSILRFYFFLIIMHNTEFSTHWLSKFLGSFPRECDMVCCMYLLHLHHFPRLHWFDFFSNCQNNYWFSTANIEEYARVFIPDYIHFYFLHRDNQCRLECVNYFYGLLSLSSNKYETSLTNEQSTATAHKNHTIVLYIL
jgi:hypothetical protein